MKGVFDLAGAGATSWRLTPRIPQITPSVPAREGYRWNLLFHITSILIASNRHRLYLFIDKDIDIDARYKILYDGNTILSCKSGYKKSLDIYYWKIGYKYSSKFDSNLRWVLYFVAKKLNECISVINKDIQSHLPHVSCVCDITSCKWRWNHSY